MGSASEIQLKDKDKEKSALVLESVARCIQCIKDFILVFMSQIDETPAADNDDFVELFESFDMENEETLVSEANMRKCDTRRGGLEYKTVIKPDKILHTTGKALQETQ